MIATDDIIDCGIHLNDFTSINFSYFSITFKDGDGVFPKFCKYIFFKLKKWIVLSADPFFQLNKYSYNDYLTVQFSSGPFRRTFRNQDSTIST